jgi:hypothetical protein
VNTGYLIWFAILVVVVGAALAWLAVGEVPEVEVPGFPDSREAASEPAGQDGVAEPT